MLEAQAPRTLLIAPWIALGSVECWLEDPVRASLLRANQLTPAILVRNLLDSLQSPGGRNDIHLGYMMAIGVFDLFSKDDTGNWAFDEEKLRFFTDLFREVGRPVVVHLRANHFAGNSPLVHELLEDETSHARTNDGSWIREMYYTNALFAPTFALDENIPLNRYRFGGFRRLASALAEFDRDHPGIIHAYTLAGELHHLMPEFENPLAAGRFENVQMTDYSDASIREFRLWLKTRYSGVLQLNERFGTSFPAWGDVQPPREDLRTGGTAPLWMHMDSYADGILPVFGWAELPSGAAVDVYVDGRHAGQAEYGLSRLDVYEALERLKDSDIGFRFDIDYRRVSPGPHLIHAVIRPQSGQPYLIGRRTVVVGRAAASGDNGPVYLKGLDDLPPAGDEPTRFAWLDHPPEGMPLLFNPYAAEWQKFRELQVQALLAKFAQIAVDAGLPREKLYSHQIMPNVEGTWNQVAFAVPSQAVESDLFTAGINLYGGATVYRGLAEYTKERKYAVPEFHPRMGRLASKDVFRRALEYHRQLGAEFLCPYFMILREPSGVTANAVADLVIHPLNPSFGSLFFYSALIEFLNQRS